jgi:formate hydrogenlyase subunit 7
MRLWALRGLATIRGTTRFPRTADHTAGVTPGRPVLGPREAAAQCPTGAIQIEHAHARADFDLCVHCMRCRRGEHAMGWTNDYTWSRAAGSEPILPAAFSHSIHVRVVDAGDCGACLAELLQLTSPQYSLHRLGIFLTPTPRNADVLLVVGPVTRGMRQPLRDTFDAMPTPKRVVAVGACAVNGGLFGPDFAADGGAADAIPVDRAVPGCPPPPLAVIEALLAVMGRKLPTTAPQEATS